MLNNSKNRKQAGFTIIEVLIVLAIAGLIMIVVFLAVPALQRSGRNNSLNTDANNILTSVSNYVSNNNGTIPTAASISGTTVTISGPAGSNSETATVDTGIPAGAVSYGTANSLNTAVKGAVEVVVGTNAKCNATASGLMNPPGGTARSYVVLYVAESGSGNIVKCIGG